nr:hypothetical protein [Angustibacter aerolatus]
MTSEQGTGASLENLSREERRFPPSEEFAAGAVATAEPVRAGGRRPAGVLGRAGARAC